VSSCRKRSGVEIVAHPFDNLLIDCARDVGASVIIRGLRAVADFEYEFQMVGMNRAMDSSIETVFLMAEARHQAIASKLVKEIARLGGDVTVSSRLRSRPRCRRAFLNQPCGARAEFLRACAQRLLSANRRDAASSCTSWGGIAAKRA
jgi:pantetheine-phosphate adenylyltransferase